MRTALREDIRRTMGTLDETTADPATAADTVRVGSVARRASRPKVIAADRATNGMERRMLNSGTE
ncbi:hypothetical protein GCM10027188_09330 [Lysobacter humi (ex Lee et al. 2017)]